jgi:protein TonB
MIRCARQRSSSDSLFARSLCASLAIHLMAAGGAMVVSARTRPLVLGRPASDGTMGVVAWRTSSKPGRAAGHSPAETRPSPDLRSEEPELEIPEPPIPEPPIPEPIVEELFDPWPQHAPAPEALAEASRPKDQLPQESGAEPIEWTRAESASAGVQPPEAFLAEAPSQPEEPQPQALSLEAGLLPESLEPQGAEFAEVAEAAEAGGPYVDPEAAPGSGDSLQDEQASPGGAFDLLAPSYPALSQRLGEEGVVIFNLHVDSTGRVLSFELRESSGYPRLDKAAIDAVRTWRRVDRRFLNLRLTQSLAGTHQHRVRFRLE